MGREHLRPGARRRTVHRAGCPSPPAGEPLAAYPRRPPRPGAAAAGVAAQCARLRPARGVVLYATCSPVVEETAGVVGSVLADRPDTRLEDTSRWSRRRPTRSRPTSRAPCSCGRTATAPTRCSWRCSGGSTGLRPRMTRVAGGFPARARARSHRRCSTTSRPARSSRPARRSPGSRLRSAPTPRPAGVVDATGQLVHGDVEGSGQVPGPPLVGDGVRRARRWPGPRGSVANPAQSVRRRPVHAVVGRADR